MNERKTEDAVIERRRKENRKKWTEKGTQKRRMKERKTE